MVILESFLHHCSVISISGNNIMGMCGTVKGTLDGDGIFADQKNNVKNFHGSWTLTFFLLKEVMEGEDREQLEEISGW